MDTTPCWMLTDGEGQTPAGGTAWFRWGRGVSHGVWGHRFLGYSTDCAHLPYLLDPIYERYGPGARLWLSEVGDPQPVDSVRVASNVWTTLDEWPRPAWLGTEAEMRVRLRFALLAAAGASPSAALAARLRAISLRSILAAVRPVEQAWAESRLNGSAPQATCLAAMAVRSAAALVSGENRPLDIVARHYPVYAWHAAMAATCACVDLSDLADEAARWECQEAHGPVRAPAFAAVC